MRPLCLIAPAFLIVFGLTANLESTPPLWWDEGWTLSVARNWVELGHYGRLLNGQLVPGGLEAGFPVTAGVAFSFWLFGVGLYQARLVSVIFTLATIALLYELTRRLYGHSIAIGTLVVVILMNGHVDINPLIAGRQVLGELPAICFLLAGYLCLLLSERRPALFLPTAALFWSIALVTKVQVQPFWALSLFVTLLFLLFRRQWRFAVLISLIAVGSIAFYFVFQQLISRDLSVSQISGLTQVVALALSRHTRLVVLAQTLLFGFPVLLGLCWALWGIYRNPPTFKTHTDVARFSFFVLAITWFLWYVALSLGWPRYFLPPALLGSVFVATMLYDWSNKFNLAYTIHRAALALKTLRFAKENTFALAAIILITMSSGQTLTFLHHAYFINSDYSVKDTVEFLNTDTPTNALIETYESELFFLLNRRYHYPPDQVHVDLIRRNSFGENIKIDYDPLITNPDYIIVGPQSKFWELYDPFLNTEEFRLVRSYNRYEIFQRVR